MKVCTILSIFCYFFHAIQGRPQSLQIDGNIDESQTAVRPSILFVRPVFDRNGNLIEDLEDGDIDEDAIAADFQRQREEIQQQRQQRPQQQDDDVNEQLPTNRDSVDFGEEEVPTREEVLFGNLPTFGNPDTVLQATAQLQSRDPFQEFFVPVPAQNAGGLQLTGEVPGALDLFPPLVNFIKSSS